MEILSQKKPPKNKNKNKTQKKPQNKTKAKTKTIKGKKIHPENPVPKFGVKDCLDEP